MPGICPIRMEHAYAFGVAIRKRRHKNRFHHSEDGRICSDPQGQRERRGCRERGVLPKLTRRETEVAKETCNAIFPTVSAPLVGCRAYPARLYTRLALSFFRRESAFYPCRGCFLEK